MTPSESKNTWLIILALAALMALTRSHHFATVTHLPDASWAVFFLAGFYLRAAWVFAALLALAGLSDYIAITQFGVSDFCVSIAYGFLLPAYAALWFAGRWYSRKYRFNPSTLLPLAASAMTAALVTELLSSGSFYFLSGRYPDPSLGAFGSRLATYFPSMLSGMALYLATAVLVHAALVMTARRAAEAGRGYHAG